MLLHFLLIVPALSLMERPPLTTYTSSSVPNPTTASPRATWILGNYTAQLTVSFYISVLKIVMFGTLYIVQVDV